jgi:hypothetical protein
MTNPLDEMYDSPNSAAPENPLDSMYADSAPAQEEDGDFVRGLKNYIPQTKQIGGDLTTLAGLGMRKALGPGEVSQGMIDKGQEWSSDAAGQMVGKDTDEFTGALDKGVGSLLTDYVPYQAGQAVGMIGESLATAAAGAAVGGAIGSAGAGVGAVPGALAGGIAGAIEGAAVKQGVKALARKLLAEQGEGAAQSFLAKEAAKATGQKIGLNAGLATGALAHGFGETGGRAIGEATKDGGSIDNVDFGRVVPAAIGHAGLEFVGDKIGLGAISKEGWRAAGTGAGAIAKTAAAKAGVTGLKEAPVEAGQTVLERYAGNLNLADAEAGKEYLNAAAAGATMGGVIGGAGGVHTALSQPDPATFVQPTPTAENPAPAPVPRPDPNAGPLSRAAFALPAPSIAGFLPSPEQTLFADAAGNVSPSGPARDVDREYRPTGREKGPQSFGSGMDQQADRGAAPSVEGDYIPRSQYAPKNQSPATQNTFDGERPALTDTRPQGTDSFTVDAAGNAVADKVNRAPTADYVQGGRGMDQQTPVGKRYSNPIQAKNAISKAAQPKLLEVVKVADKHYEVKPTAAAEPAPSVTAQEAPIQFAAGQKWRHGKDVYHVNKVLDDGRAQVSTPSGGQLFTIRPEQAATEKWAQDDAAQPVTATVKPKAPARKIDRDRDSLTHAVIRLGGIKTEWRQDTTGDTKGNAQLPGVGALWGDKTGTSIDDMASLLDQHGYVPVGEMEKDGGVRWLQAALQDEASGSKTHFAPGSKRQEEEAVKAEEQRQADTAAQQEASGALDSAQAVESDLLDDTDLMEVRAEAAAKHTAELDAIFGDANDGPSPGTPSADSSAQEEQRNGTGESGSAGSGKRPPTSDNDARATGAPETAPSLELSSQTEAKLASSKATNQTPVKDTAPANTDDQSGPVAPVKWFGTQNKASFYLKGKKLQATHEVVEADPGRFEVREKAQPVAEPVAAAEQPDAFVNNPDGSIDFGEITPEMATAAGRQAGKIRLQQGDDSRGLRHIELRHGAQIRKAGYDSVEQFVAAAVKSPDFVWRPESTTQLAVIELIGKGKAVFIQLQPGTDAAGDYYAVNTAFPVSVTYAEKKKGWKLLWSREAVPAVASGELSPFAEADQKAGDQPTMPSGQSSADSVAQPAAAESAAEPKAKVEDFGEKIGGARKDTATTGKKKTAKETDSRPAWQRRYEITQIAASTTPSEVGRWVISDKRKLDWKKQPRQLRGNYATEEEALQMLPVIAVAMKHRVLSVRDGDGTGFEIWRDVTDRKRVKVVDQVFPSRETGMEYMAKNAEAIIETNTTFGEADLPRPDSTVRKGAERRTGPVMDSAFTEAFGFRGVEFGNWNNQEERQQLLNDAYDGLLDLADVMGIPARAISLNGDLALAFGARGQGLSGARAHYEPGKVVINLTKLNGAGSLAHEWFHALDHYFARQDGKSSSEWSVDKDGTRALKISSNFESDAASSGFLRNNSGVREVLRDAYTDLMKTMFSKGETYVEDTARVDEFVGRSRKEVTDRLDDIRRDLAEQKDPKYWKRSNKPASAEQLAEFDTVAQLVRDGTALTTELRANPGKSRSVLSSMRWTNDALEKMSEIYKAVRGRTGFNAETNGVLDRLRQTMGAYSSRLKMLADAQNGEQKLKKVPTQFAMDAKELDQGRGTDYWTTPHEMAARAFQGYVEDKVAEANGSSPFLNFGPENAGILTPWGWKRPFPAGDERKAINQSFDKLVEIIQTRETEDGNVVLFSRSATGATGATLGRRDVEQIAVGLVTEATVARRFVFSSWEELPQPIKDRAAAQGAKPGEIKAVHWRGKTYLVDRRFADVRDVERAIFHEYYAHYGLRQQYGKDLYHKLLRTWAKIGGTKGVRAMAAEQGFNIDHYIEGAKQDKELTEAQRRVLVMDELLAHMAESTGSLKRIIQEWYGAVRDWLRDNGWAELAKLNAADMAFMLRGARQAALHADGRSVSGQPLFQWVESVKQISTAAFKNWFGSSKVVDKQGAPKILYHGTGEDFTSFDQGRSGSSTRHSTAPLGIFMTGSRDTAQAYADKASDGMPGYSRVMQLYAAIRNPYMMSVEESQAIDSPGEAVTLRAKLEREGYDGINLKGTDTWIAFSNTQMKSATDNNGEFDEWSGDIRFRRSESASTAEAAAQTAWQSPSASQWDDLTYKLQDKHIDTKRVLEAIRATGKAISDDLDVYLQEELYHGRAAKRTEDFVTLELEPLMQYLAAAGLKMQDVEEYLHARHAKEANQVIAERNPKLPDGGSGMTNAEADAVLAAYNGIRRKQLEVAATKVDAIIASTRQTFVDYGLESQATVDGWGKTFAHYVPLMREQEGDGMSGLGTGQGFSIKGRETKGRTGSTRKVVDILANVAMQRERAIVRGEKNRVAAALVGLAKANPSDLWSVDVVPTQQVLDKDGKVKTQADSLYKQRDNVVVAKIPNADGTVTERAVVFNEDDARALRMAAALKNLDAPQLEGLLGATAKVTRYLAAVNTQYNPIFGTTNLARDVQGAALNLSSTPLAGKQREVLGQTLAALGGIYFDMRSRSKGKGGTHSEWAQLWEDFQDVGGQTGYRDQFRTSADRGEALAQALDPSAWTETKFGRFFTAGGRLKVPAEVARKAMAPIFSWLDDYNTAMENSTRLAAYKTALDAGMSKAQAASLAKNLTTNFNRKGQSATQVGALYAFFNASVQGTARIGDTLFDMDAGKPKTLRLSATGKKIVMGGVMLGGMQALLLVAAGFDDGEPPDFVRERNLIIPTGGKNYITIPMPLGFHVLPNLGRIPVEFALSGFDKPAEQVMKLLGLLSDTFNPIGNAGLSMQTLAPTVLDPLAALAENKDFSGRAIAKESFNKLTPGPALAKDTASLPALWISEGINYLTGGTKHVRGALSPTPDQIDYLFGQATGGVGREATKAMQVGQALGSGDEVPAYKIPLVGRFFGGSDNQGAKQSAFYESMDEVRRHAEQVKGLRLEGKMQEASDYAQEHKQARLRLAANAADREVRKLRNRRRELEQQGASREVVRAIEQRMTQRMERFTALAKQQ